jgi:hypothetical protein
MPFMHIVRYGKWILSPPRLTSETTLAIDRAMIQYYHLHVTTAVAAGF